MEREDVYRLLSQIQDLPALPASVMQILQLTEDPNCNASDLSQVLMTDPALAARMLKLSNSAYYGFSHTIASVQQAVTLLGYSTLKNVLLSASVFDIYKMSSMCIDIPGLWKHSVATASAAKLIAKKVRYPHPEKAFTVGLMHDIGKVVIARYMPRSLAEIATMVRTKNCGLFDAEVKVIGLSHAQIGAYVLHRWKLPSDISDAVQHHHAPAQSTFQFYLAAICYLANILAHRAQIGRSGDNLERELDPVIRDYFGLTNQVMLEMQDQLTFKRLEIEAFCRLSAGA
jgi:putative nucleotidyltransferase with HDIG domain